MRQPSDAGSARTPASSPNPPRARLGDVARLAFGLALLSAIFLGCDALARALHSPLPGNVVGMGVLFASLATGVLPIAWVERAADLLLRHLSLLFVPAAVAVARHRRLLGASWMSLTVVVVASTAVVLLVSGLLAERMVRRETRENKR